MDNYAVSIIEVILCAHGLYSLRLCCKVVSIYLGIAEPIKCSLSSSVLLECRIAFEGLVS